MLTWFKRNDPADQQKNRVVPRRLRSEGVKVKRGATLTKRRKFLIVSLLLTLGLWIIQSLSVEARYTAIIVLAILSAGLTGWSLIKDLRGVAWVLDLILPTLYPTVVAVFYFLLPQASVTRWIVLLVFSIFGRINSVFSFSISGCNIFAAIVFFISILSALSFILHVFLQILRPFR